MEHVNFEIPLRYACNLDVKYPVRYTSLKFSWNVRPGISIWYCFTLCGLYNQCSKWIHQGSECRERRGKNLGLGPRTLSHSEVREKRRNPRAALTKEEDLEGVASRSLLKVMFHREGHDGKCFCLCSEMLILLFKDKSHINCWLI